jgi:hypothetical protein
LPNKIIPAVIEVVFSAAKMEMHGPACPVGFILVHRYSNKVDSFGYIFFLHMNQIDIFGRHNSLNST